MIDYQPSWEGRALAPVPAICSSMPFMAGSPANKERRGSHLHHRGEGIFEVVVGARVHDLKV